MSDCSIEAMKPKRYEVCPHCEGRLIEDISEYEPSLTHLYCLDCGCSVTRERKEQPISSTGIYAEDLQKCVELIAGVTGAPTPDCPCNLTDVYHSVKDLQQRNQQLEQVARDMFFCIKSPLDFVERTGNKYIRDGHYQWTYIFHEQLSKLGVSLDG